MSMTVTGERTMELIEVGETCDPTPDAPGGAIMVSHSSTTLRRGLEHGEDVVLLDVQGRFRAGTVTDIEFTLDDTLYTIEVGVRLPSEAAAARMTGAPEAPSPKPGPVSVQAVLDLLGELRDRARR